MNRCEASGEQEGSPPFLEAQVPNWSQSTLPISVLTQRSVWVGGPETYTVCGGGELLYNNGNTKCNTM